MKILFLDIDDVLCTQRYNIVSKNVWREFDPVAVKIVYKICKDTGCKIVLSSSWGQYEHTLNQFYDEINSICPELKEYYFTEDFIPKRKNTRYETIRAWLNNHKEVTHYCILDDHGSWTGPKDDINLVLVDDLDGVGYVEYVACMDILSDIDVIKRGKYD